MGVVKSEWIDSQERGWDAPDKHVCADCVEDQHLKDLIELSVCCDTCDYCDASSSTTDIAAPVESIMDAIMGALTHFFAEPGGAGVPYESAEGGYLVEGTDTGDALQHLPFECHDDLFEDVVNAISDHNDYWVKAAGGHWASSQRSQVLSWAWDRFANHVKHRRRYFFAGDDDESYGEDIEPGSLLPELAGVITEMDLIKGLDAGIPLFRARLRGASEDWPLDEKNLGAAPENRAAAGRMNSAGIPYLYVAMEKETALAEVLRAPPCGVAMGKFETARKLRVLNLIDLPDISSVFDSERLREREFTIFLRRFVEAISRPVSKDGAEHIEYVPSQVVCEYFAAVHDRKNSLDGILYPSAVRSGGRNLVLFPDSWLMDKRFPQANFATSELLDAATWADITDLVS